MLGRNRHVGFFVVGLLLALVVSGGLARRSIGADEKDEKARKALVRQGARQWSAYCGGCHNARPPSERSPSEWDTIMFHMRVRANLPAQDAEALLAFLKSR
jgi:hypothetical protein